MNTWLYNCDLIPLFIGLACLLACAWEVGYRSGRRFSRDSKQASSQSVAIEAGILTLFALLLGFAFSMSVARYETRKQLACDESNAIGTALLRTDLLKGQERNSLRQALFGYMDARLEFYQAPFGSPDLSASEKKADLFQGHAWELASDLGRKTSTPTVALLIGSLNEMIDLREKQRVAFENVIPRAVLFFLLFLSFLVIGVVGYLNGLAGARQIILSVLFAAVVAITLFIIFDLDRPRRGPTTLQLETLLRLKTTFSRMQGSTS